MRLAYGIISFWSQNDVRIWYTDIFDIRARVNSDNIAVLDAKVMSDYTIHACAAIIQIIICENDEDRILALLAFYQDCVTAEEL